MAAAGSPAAADILALVQRLSSGGRSSSSSSFEAAGQLVDALIAVRHGCPSRLSQLRAEMAGAGAIPVLVQHLHSGSSSGSGSREEGTAVDVTLTLGVLAKGGVEFCSAIVAAGAVPALLHCLSSRSSGGSLDSSDATCMAALVAAAAQVLWALFAARHYRTGSHRGRGHPCACAVPA